MLGGNTLSAAADRPALVEFCRNLRREFTMQVLLLFGVVVDTFDSVHRSRMVQRTCMACHDRGACFDRAPCSISPVRTAACRDPARGSSRMSCCAPVTLSFGNCQDRTTDEYREQR